MSIHQHKEEKVKWNKQRLNYGLGQDGHKITNKQEHKL